MSRERIELPAEYLRTEYRGKIIEIPLLESTHDLGIFIDELKEIEAQVGGILPPGAEYGLAVMEHQYWVDNGGLIVGENDEVIPEAFPLWFSGAGGANYHRVLMPTYEDLIKNRALFGDWEVDQPLRPFESRTCIVGLMWIEPDYFKTTVFDWASEQEYVGVFSHYLAAVDGDKLLAMSQLDKPQDRNMVNSDLIEILSHINSNFALTDVGRAGKEKENKPPSKRHNFT